MALKRGPVGEAAEKLRVRRMLHSPYNPGLNPVVAI